MNIAVVTGRFPTTTETFVVDQITGLIDAGHDVTIIASPPKSTAEVPEVVDDYGLKDRVHYWSGFSDIPGIDAATIARAFRKLPGVVSTCRESVIRLMNRALRLSKAPRFDAILCHFGHLGLQCEMLRRLGVLRGVLATVFHGYDMSALIGEKGEDFYEPLFETGDLFLPISDYWRRRLVEMGAPVDRTTVHRMGVDPERFRFRERCPHGGEIRVLTVGRLVEKKGVRYGLEAFSKLADEFPTARYTVVGDGPLRRELEVLVRGIGIEDRVDFAGWKSRDGVLEALQRHHLLVAPSVTARDGDMEGIPVVLMEAMATGMPVISTRHSGIPELVADGKSGFLVAERDVVGLAGALRQLLEAPGRWGEFGRCGRRIVEERFCVDRWNERLVEVLGRVA